MYSLIVFLPILGSAIAGLFGRIIGARASELVTTGCLFASAALSAVAFYDVALQGHNYIIPILPWIHSASFAVDWTVRIDTITAVMLVVVTGVSSLVHLYSIGYMHEDPSRARFFSLELTIVHGASAWSVPASMASRCSSTCCCVASDCRAASTGASIR